MLGVATATRFRRVLRLCNKRGYNLALLNAVIDTLRIPQPLPPINKNHGLSGNWAGFQEYHIQSDWLLIYTVDGNTLYLDRTGTHADLFGK